MQKDLRLRSIRDIIKEEGQAEVNALSERLGVSCVTIRSDLDVLEKEGFLFRTHGGAILRTPEEAASAFALPSEMVNVEKKAELAALAAQHVRENSWIYLSAGTTCTEVAKALAPHYLNVVTGNLTAAQILARGNRAQVLIPGGNLVSGPDYMFLRGDWFLRAMGEISIEQAYLSVSGADMDGYSWGNAQECELHTMETLRRVSKEIVVLIDSTKFNKRSFVCPERLEYADTVITNRDIPDDYRNYFETHGVKLIMPE